MLMSECSQNLRSVDDILAIVDKAKLSAADLLPQCQTLEFAGQLAVDSGSSRLVQVDEHVIGALLSGTRLVIRGDKDDAAVLCTDDRTYEVREAETSNSLLLLNRLSLPDELTTSSSSSSSSSTSTSSTTTTSTTTSSTNNSSEAAHSVVSRQVSGVFHRYLELRPCQPRLRRLHQLLQRAPYRGRLESTAVGYSLHQLQLLVQSSRQQLLAELESGHTVLIDGVYYGLQFEYEFSVLDRLLRLADENSWPLDRVNGRLAVEELTALEPRAVLESCLARYFTPLESDGEWYQCCQVAVARMFARMLLAAVSQFNLREFVDVWTQSLPAGVHASLSDLAGVAVAVNSCSSPPVIVPLLPHQLPEPVADRLRALFNIKPGWPLAELQPYFSDVATTQSSLTSLLAKHCRLTTLAGVKQYVPRHTN